MLVCISGALNKNDLTRDEVCGVILQLRQKQDRLVIWTRDASTAKTEAIERVGYFYKMALGLPADFKSSYQPHTPAKDRYQS
jgi:hypothetical protein